MHLHHLSAAITAANNTATSITNKLSFKGTMTAAAFSATSISSTRTNAVLFVASSNAGQQQKSTIS